MPRWRSSSDPFAWQVDEFDVEGIPVNETLKRDRTGGEFLEHQHCVVLIGCAGTGKTSLAAEAARSLFLKLFDLVKQPADSIRLLVSSRSHRWPPTECRSSALIENRAG